MNRKQRRANVRKVGQSWKMARKQAKENAAGIHRAVTRTPEQARRMLAEWAARGGKEKQDG